MLGPCRCIIGACRVRGPSAVLTCLFALLGRQKLGAMSLSEMLSAGLPSPAPRVAIRGSVSDNSHERFAAAHVHNEASEASSSGVISHVVLVCSIPLCLRAHSPC